MEVSERPAPSGRTVALLAFVAASPALVAAVAAAFTPWRPVGDQALEVLRIAEVGGRHTPLVGAWSRWGWAHPGPWLFWLLAPFHAVGSTRGVLVGTALVAAASAAGAVVVAARRDGPTTAALVAAAAAALFVATGLDGTVDPWNPYVAMLPFLLVLVAAAAAFDGDLPAAVVAVLAGSWCVQAHAMYLLPVAAVLVVAAVGTGRGWRTCPPTTRRRAAVAGAVGTALLWIPPLLDQAVGTGNLGRIVRYALGGGGTGDGVVGAGRAMGAANAQLSPVGPWVGGSDAGPLGLAASSRWPWFPLVVAALGAVLVVRRRSGRPVGCPVVALAGVVASFVATARISGLLGPYLLRFWWPVAAVCAVVLVDELVALLPETVLRRTPPVLGGLAAAGVVLALVAGLPLRVPVAEVGGAVDEVVGPTVAALDARRPVLVQETDLRYWGFVTPAMVLALERDGLDARVLPTDLTSLQYGDRRTIRPGPASQVVSVVGLDELAAGAAPPGREVARSERLDRRERREADALHGQVARALGLSLDAPRPPLTLPGVRRRLRDAGFGQPRLARLLELESRGPSYAVFVDAGRPSP